jgi:hypothetical protein
MTKKLKFSMFFMLASLFSVLVLVGCGDKPQKAGDVKLLESMTTDSRTVRFEYDDQNRIVKMLHYHDGILSETQTLTYAGDDLVALEHDVEGWNNMPFNRKGNTISTGDMHAGYTFTVNKDGHIIKLETESDMQRGESAYKYRGGNLTKIESVETFYDGEMRESSFEYKYDKKKSPFFHCNTPRWFLQHRFGNDFGLNNNITDVAIDGTWGISVAYEYDADGFPTRQTKTVKWSDEYTITTTFTYRGVAEEIPAGEAEKNDTPSAPVPSSEPEPEQEQPVDAKIDLTEIFKRETYFIGSIGDEEQKMGIVFLSTVRMNDTEYRVTGISKVRDNIRGFEGTIEVQGVGELFYDGWAEGRVDGKYQFKADRNLSSTGEFEGTFNLQWGGNTKIVHDIGKRHSTEIEVTFRGNWRSYVTGAIRKTSWGNSQWLLPGTFNDGQEYTRAENYRSIGWGSYFDRQDDDEQIRQKAVREYREEWFEWWK